MQKLISVIAIALACGACSSKELEKIVTPPEALSTQSSSQGIINSEDSSSDESMAVSSNQAFSSMAASSSIGLPANSSASSSPNNTGSSSVAYTASSEAAASSSNDSAGTPSSAASSEPVAATPGGEQLFTEQCASCHDLESNLPFQIGANLSFTELHQTISNTMPFNSSNHCTGECAMELAYYIENARL